MLAFFKSNYIKKITIIVFLFVGCFLVFIFFYSLLKNNQVIIDSQYYGVLQKKDKSYYESHVKGNPVYLQEDFLKDVKNGVNNKMTKSNIYFITHRYFDNGGNIYEIYDYIEKNPDIHFLKEAEYIYPNVFKKIKNKEIETRSNSDSVYAFVAYIEILDKYGYADVAALSTAANRYVYGLFFKKTKLDFMSGTNATSGQISNFDRDVEKSITFLKLARNDIDKILITGKAPEDIVERDVLVGINQYASALRYLEYLGVDTKSFPDHRKMFDFAMDYSSSTVVELKYFTSLVNASTLAIVDSSEVEIKNALLPIINYDMKKPNAYRGRVIMKILNSRFEKKSDNIRGLDMSIYGKYNTLLLASKVPEFKVWLIKNGWEEKDFIYWKKEDFVQ